VVLGVIIFAEAPSGLQVLGVAAILCGLIMVARSPREPARPL
jgi:drug/metabolite transporter (DMT)-like permease